MWVFSLEQTTAKFTNGVKMKEVWKPIILDDIQSRYAVSSFGRIFDLKNKKYMKQNDNGAGYKNVPLMGPKSKLRIRYVHRLVAIAFIENPFNLPQVGHGDHDRANNKLSNLKWTNQKDNTEEGILAGRINAKKRPNTKRLSEDQIYKIAELELKGYGVNEIALTLDFPRTTISSVFNGRSNWKLFEKAREEVKEIH